MDFYPKIISKSNSYNITKHLDSYIDILFINFKSLSLYKNLKHDKQHLKELLTSNNMFGVLIYNNNNKIIGYAFGEFMKLDDGRSVYYLSYIYIIKSWRKKGIGSYIMNLLTEQCKKHDVHYLMLICDTEDPLVYNFYLTRGFMPDLKLRRYEKYDVMSITL